MKITAGGVVRGGAAAWLLAASSWAAAQAFPSKTVRLVVPFAAGGSNDVVARAMAPALSQAFGQSVVVENRPGGNTLIGTEAVVRSPADGHTVLIAGFTMASMTALRTKLPFEPLRELAGITRLGTQPFVLSVHPSLPVKSIAELVALARLRQRATFVGRAVEIQEWY
jgi:tripartite-type tricarboxylate transporter receptor subunit TctC